MAQLLLLIIVLLSALFAVHLINQREEKVRQQRLHQRSYRWRADQLEEVLVGLEAVMSDRSVALCVNREILHLLEQMLALEQGDKTPLETRLRYVREREEGLREHPDQPRASRLRESDAEMARAKGHMEHAAKVLRRQHQEGRLDETLSLSDLLQSLSWQALMVEVITYIVEGHKALRRGDITTSQAYYKKAQGLLISSDHPDPRRMAMIRELGEVILGKRAALSEELMPEDAYNPGV
ncbi:hypothetical protein [Marinimicrobium sp. ARAG 43.8]|uniref:hypothetical protein n=1 Tax=Marinimicrobium sp. ARAG 43.8 TaxID=3418719 RepID=UPI003CE82B4D